LQANFKTFENKDFISGNGKVMKAPETAAAGHDFGQEGPNEVKNSGAVYDESFARTIFVFQLEPELKKTLSSSSSMSLG
jgi:hypothetical protein